MTDTLHLTNEYDLIVSYLMQTTAAKEAFTENYEQNYLDALVEMMEQTREVVKGTAELTEKIEKADLGTAEDVVNRIDQILIAVQEFQGVSKEDIRTCYQDGMQQIKDIINNDFLAEDQEKITNTMRGLKGLQGIAEIAAGTYEEVVDAYAVYSAGIKATQQWREVWQEIADSAASENSEEGRQLSTSINGILRQVEEAGQDMATALANKALLSGSGNTVQYAVSLGSDLWDDSMKTWSIGKAIREGLVGGITISNLLMNCDDIAYYGEMLIDTGMLAIHGWDALKSAESQLKSDRDFAAAVKFDEAFNIYKEIQMAACDYVINYYQAIATAPVGYIFKYTTDEQIAGTVQLLAEKATWGTYQCHEEEKEVINNGGRFVGYKKNTYYWRLNQESVEQTGILGGFHQVPDVKNELICRTASGGETVLLKDTGSGPMFICGDCIFYKKGESSWGVCEIDGTPVTSYENIEVLAADTEHGIVICSNYESGIFGITMEGERISLAPVNASFLGIKGLLLYYGVAGETQMDFYSIRLDGLDERSIGNVTLPGEGWGPSIGDVWVQEDGIYLSCGTYAGTGVFFSNAGVYRLGYDGGIETIVDPASNEVNFPKICITQTDEESTLYYYGGEGYSNVGFWDSWVSDNVYAVDLKDGSIQPESFILSNIGDIVCLDGSVYTLLDESGQYTEILSAETAAQLGYTDLGEHSGDGEAFVPYLDIVGGTAYLTITKLTEDSAYSMGWRTGYRRDVMQTYEIEIGSGKAVKINEY